MSLSICSFFLLKRSEGTRPVKEGKASLSIYLSISTLLISFFMVLCLCNVCDKSLNLSDKVALSVLFLITFLLIIHYNKIVITYYVLSIGLTAQLTGPSCSQLSPQFSLL